MSGHIPLFGTSQVRHRILGFFFLHPGQQAHVREVARAVDGAASAVGRELRKLEESGILTSATVGRARVFRVDDRSAIARDAAALFSKTEGVEALLRQALAPVPEIEAAWIFGSHADRTERPDSDVDVFIVGSPRQSALSEALMPIEDRLGRSVHTTTMSPEEFARRRAQSGFVAEVMRRPRIPLVGKVE